jgi:hypothetical protein
MKIMSKWFWILLVSLAGNWVIFRFVFLDWILITFYSIALSILITAISTKGGKRR